MEEKSFKAKFIVFEGLDGCGKTTQLKTVAGLLADAGIDTLMTREPTGGEYGRRIRRCLAGEEKADGRTIGELFALDRAEHTAEIAAALDAGKTVLCDRYFLSSLAYQGDCMSAAELTALNAAALERLKIDLTLYFALTPEAAMERTAKRGEPLELFERLTYQQGVARRYAEAVAERREKDNIVTLDALPPELTVTRELLIALTDRFGKI